MVGGQRRSANQDIENACGRNLRSTRVVFALCSFDPLLLCPSIHRPSAMKITSVEPIHLRVPVVEELPDGTLDVLVVLIHTDEGITGIGEVTSQSYVCKACFEAGRSAARRHGLTSILVGEDPL